MIRGAAGKRFCTRAEGTPSGKRFIRIHELTVLGAEHVARMQQVQAPPHVAEQQRGDAGSQQNPQERMRFQGQHAKPPTLCITGLRRQSSAPARSVRLTI